jgi:hypothetical protein
MDHYVRVSPPTLNLSSTLDRVFDAIDRLELDLLADARVFRDRAHDLREHAHTPTDTDAKRAAVLAKLVAGDLDPEQGAEELAVIARLVDRDKAIPSLLKDAAVAADRASWTSIQRHGDQLVDDLRPIVTKIVQRSLQLADVIPDGVRDDEQAVRAGGKIAAAWAELRHLQDQWRLLHALTDELRSGGALPVNDPKPYPPSYLPADYRYGNPELVTQTSFGTVPAPLHLAEAHQLGARPGIYSAAEVAERFIEAA